MSYHSQMDKNVFFPNINRTKIGSKNENIVSLEMGMALAIR